MTESACMVVPAIGTSYLLRQITSPGIYLLRNYCKFHHLQMKQNNSINGVEFANTFDVYTFIPILNHYWKRQHLLHIHRR